MCWRFVIATCRVCNEHKPIRALGKCSACYLRDYERPLRECARCGKLRQIHGRDLCQTCYRPPERPCKRCGCVRSIKRHGLCRPCGRQPTLKHVTCVECGEHQPHYARDMCQRCYNRTTQTIKRRQRPTYKCSGCGEVQKIHAKNRCRKCYYIYNREREIVCTKCGHTARKGRGVHGVCHVCATAKRGYMPMRRGSART